MIETAKRKFSDSVKHQLILIMLPTNCYQNVNESIFLILKSSISAVPIN